MDNEIKTFIRFLKENNCYEPYIFNLNEEYNNSVNLKKIYYKHNPRDIIINSFCWWTSNQGYPFWVIIDKKWQMIYDNILNKS